MAVQYHHTHQKHDHLFSIFRRSFVATVRWCIFADTMATKRACRCKLRSVENPRLEYCLNSFLGFNSTFWNIPILRKGKQIRCQCCCWVARNRHFEPQGKGDMHTVNWAEWDVLVSSDGPIFSMLLCKRCRILCLKLRLHVLLKSHFGIIDLFE